MEKTIINEDEIKGNPSRILSYLETDLANCLLQGVNDDVILKMRQLIDVFEILYDRVNDDYISFKWNSIGNWYLDYFDIYSKKIMGKALLQQLNNKTYLNAWKRDLNGWKRDLRDMNDKLKIDILSYFENKINICIESYYEEYTKETGNDMDFLEFRDLIISELESDNRILQVETGLDDDMLTIVFKGGVENGKN